MSHYHLEVIMPPTKDVDAAVTKAMNPFYEGSEDSYKPFWDWWKIGGRYSGAKVQSVCNKEAMKSFYKALNDAKVTVSSLTCGKQTLNPSYQIPMVDELWRKHFPDSILKVCPMFDNYTGNTEDITTLDRISDGLEAYRVMIVGPDGDAVFMIEQSYYNGVSFIDTAWDGRVKTALEMHTKELAKYGTDYAKSITPQPDWLVVTVDYHS